MAAMPPEQGGRFTCPACPRRFWSLGDKKAHVRTKHPKKPKNGAS